MRKVVGLLVALALVVIVIQVVRTRPSNSTHVPAPPTTPMPTPGQQPTGSSVTTAAVELPKVSDPAVAAVVNEMIAAWDKNPAILANVETKIPEAAGHAGKTMGRGVYLIQKKDGQMRIHFDLRNDLRIKQDEGTIVTGEVLITTIDGRHMYKFINQPGKKQALKLNIDYNEVLHIGGPHLFRELISNNTLTLLPEEMKGERATKVIKAKPNEGAWESIHYFDKATGVRIEMIEMDAQGQTTLSIKVTQINTNPAITEDSFKPVLPEGVPLEDQTGNSRSQGP